MIISMCRTFTIFQNSIYEANVSIIKFTPYNNIHFLPCSRIFIFKVTLKFFHYTSTYFCKFSLSVRVSISSPFYDKYERRVNVRNVIFAKLPVKLLSNLRTPVCLGFPITSNCPFVHIQGARKEIYIEKVRSTREKEREAGRFLSSRINSGISLSGGH